MKFSLAGFRAINKQKDFTLAPITLLVGPNGSGKSTVLKALKMTKELFYEKREEGQGFGPQVVTRYRTALAGHILDKNGGYGAVLNQNANDSSFFVECPFPLAYFPDEFSIKISYSKSDRTFRLTKIEVINKTSAKLLLKVDTVPAKRNEKSESTFVIDYEYLFNFLERTLSNLGPKKEIRDLFDRSRGTDSLLEHIRNQARRPLTDFDKVLHFHMTRDKDYPKFAFHLEDLLRKKQLKAYFNFKDASMPSETLQKNLLNVLVEKHANGSTIKHSSNFTAAEVLEHFIEHGSVGLEGDKTIPRHLAELKFKDGDKLEFVSDTLLRTNIKYALSEVQRTFSNLVYVPPNRFISYDSKDRSLPFGKLSEDLRLKLNELKAAGWWDEPVQRFIDYWLEEFGISLKLGRRTLLQGLQSFEDGFPDVELGYGLNQLLPLIYHSAIFNAVGDPIVNDEKADDFERSRLNSLPGYTFLIEEPEANLHPNFQSKLADLFIDAAWRFNHNFVIETHSEYIIRKLQYWVAKKKITPDAISIYYFDNKNNDRAIQDVVVTKIEILANGDLSHPFGEGFYDEAINLQYELLKIKKTQEN